MDNEKIKSIYCCTLNFAFLDPSNLNFFRIQNNCWTSQFGNSARRTSGEGEARIPIRNEPESRRPTTQKPEFRSPVAYIFTIFPKPSEIFFQREITELTQYLDIEVFSLWGPSNKFSNTAVFNFPKWKLLLLPFFCIQHFKKLKIFLKKFLKRPHSFANLGENLLGFSFGILYANIFKKKHYHRIHAAWGTAPAMAGWVISELTGIHFSMEAHAYDIYQNKGDTFLKEKLSHAQFVRTSTQAAKNDLIKLCKDSKKIHLIRRGLEAPKNLKPMRQSRTPLRILFMGRLVEKKGLLRLLELLFLLKQKGLKFEAKMVGKGPLYKKIKKNIQLLGLTKEVTLTDWIDERERDVLHEWADVMLFTGHVAKDGDRDGLPNVIAEAMSAGLPVISSNVGGTSEAINEKTSLLIHHYSDNNEWLQLIEKIMSDNNLYSNIQYNSREWVKNNFSLKNNMHAFSKLLIS